MRNKRLSGIGTVILAFTLIGLLVFISGTVKFFGGGKKYRAYVPVKATVVSAEHKSAFETGGAEKWNVECTYEVRGKTYSCRYSTQKETAVGAVVKIYCDHDSPEKFVRSKFNKQAGTTIAFGAGLMCFALLCYALSKSGDKFASIERNAQVSVQDLEAAFEELLNSRSGDDSGEQADETDNDKDIEG